MTWLVIAYADKARTREWARESFATRREARQRAAEWRYVGYHVDIYR